MMVQIISLGLGVQSTALYLMASMGFFPRADYAIFADTGKEGEGTYRYLEFLMDWQQRNEGIPLIVRKDKDLYQDLLNTDENRRFTSIPSFVKNEDGSVGMLRRQCTHEYKIAVIDNYIRDYIYVLPKYSCRPVTSIWQGITQDEIERMTLPLEAWKIKVFPFLSRTTEKSGAIENLSWGKTMTRKDVIAWFISNRLPVPPKSSCVFCPYQSDHSWELKKRYSPADFQAAIEVDRAIRNSGSKGIEKTAYLHRSCRPLEEVVFDWQQRDEWGECSGNCHI